jgi:hypothetical protein
MWLVKSVYTVCQIIVQYPFLPILGPMEEGILMFMSVHLYSGIISTILFIMKRYSEI